MASKKIVIIGAGPTGLGAAYRLHELGYQNWVLYEKSDDVGGHATSHVDKHGFVWDEGGHVIFSHYPYFDKLIDKVFVSHSNTRPGWRARDIAASIARKRNLFARAFWRVALRNRKYGPFRIDGSGSGQSHSRRRAGTGISKRLRADFQGISREITRLTLGMCW